MNVVTGVAAVAGLIGLYFLGGSLHEARRAGNAAAESNRINLEALVANNRAWLSPTSAQITSPIDISGPLRISVIYGNTGREPALGFAAQEEAGAVDAPAPNTSWYTVFHKNTITDVCGHTTVGDGGQTIYPTGPGQQVYNVSMNGPLTPEIISGSKILFFHGCFAYRSPITKDVVHKSEYCFLFEPLSDPTSGKRTFKSFACMYGNNAS